MAIYLQSKKKVMQAHILNTLISDELQNAKSMNTILNKEKNRGTEQDLIPNELLNNGTFQQFRNTEKIDYYLASGDTILVCKKKDLNDVINSLPINLFNHSLQFMTAVFNHAGFKTGVGT